MDDHTEIDDSTGSSPTSGQAVRPSSRLNTRATPTALALLAGVVSLGLGIYQLTLPHVLAGVSGWDEGYDEGVYVGAAIRFVHGVLPYRDFILLHPPGFVLLMSPVALIGSAFGAHFTLEVARCVTVAVMALNAVLAGLIVRPLGRVATLATAFALALWPLSVAVERTVELEPYLVFFCLLGIFLIFDGAHLSSWRRVLVGGIALGFAGNVKVWAVLPIIAVVLVCARRWRTRGLPLVLGVGTGGLIPCLPFVAFAPRVFVHEVIGDQLGRNGNVAAAISLKSRLLLLTGIGRLPLIGPRAIVAVVVCSVFGVAVLVAFALGRRHLEPVEWIALVSAVVVFVGMFEDPSSYEFYSYFPAAFVSLLLGVCVSRMYKELRARMKVRAHHRPRARHGPVAAIALFLVGICFVAQQNVDYARGYDALYSDPGAQLAAAIPSGACVVSDLPTVLLEANRFTPSSPGCPAEIDPFGAYLAEDNGMTPYQAPSYPIAFEEEWFSEIQAADYVVVQDPYSDYFPWAPTSTSWFRNNYRLVTHISSQYPTLSPLVALLVSTDAINYAHADEYVYENESILRVGG